MQNHSQFAEILHRVKHQLMKNFKLKLNFPIFLPPGLVLDSNVCI